MLRISPSDPDCPFADPITTFLGQEFGGRLESPALLDALTTQFVSTGQNRQGPVPKPEGLVAIRKVITYWMARKEPIAVLVPWGSKKPVNSRSVDVAELWALRQLMALNKRVKEVYPPGMKVDVGIEDLGGRYLWKDTESRVSSAKYVRDMIKLTRVLEAPWMEARAESVLVEEEEFQRAAERMRQLLEPYVVGKMKDLGDDRLQFLVEKMQDLGWRGEVPREQIAYYMASYSKYYPQQTADENASMIARYLSQSWARYEVGAKLADPTWDDNFIQINFPQPVPGVPAQLADRRLFCRTLPAMFARTHLPPWRARGWMRIETAGGVTPKLVPWTERMDGLEEFKVQMSSTSADCVVEVGAPYQLADWDEA